MSRFWVVAGGCVALAVMLTAFAFPGQIDAEKEYAEKCAMCHGERGAGDGPAGAAFNPAPPDFTEAAFQEARTDEQLVAAIADGKGAMPGFKAQLSEEAVAALVAYIRNLGSSDSP